jgi:ADP-heptose:LPS heptosyltransferase
MPEGRWSDVQELIGRLSQEQYDTCFVPSRSSLLSYIAWRSGIDQRVGLNLNGRGFAHTIPVRTVNGRDHESEIYLSLARAVGVEQETGMEFYATDSNRTAVMARLLNMTGWEGVMPLLVMHPGGGNNPISRDERKQWPLERFSLLAGRLARKFGAHVLLVGAEEERRLVESVAGLMSTPVVNLAGQMSLSELGALCDVADLYVGNDAGPTHIAAAVGCPTLAIFGPSDPAISGPFATKGEVIALRPEPIPQPFSWKDVVTVDEAMKAAEKLLGARLGTNRVGPLVTAGD